MIPDAMDAPPLRWGVLGPGWAAERFVRAVLANTRQDPRPAPTRPLADSLATMAVPDAIRSQLGTVYAEAAH